MNNINVYPAPSGGWMYEVWVEARAVVVGWCRTRENAVYQASRA